MAKTTAFTDLEDVAAVHIQRVMRGFLGRMEAIRKANEVYEKILDPRAKRYYYYNTRTFQTAWQVCDNDSWCPCLLAIAKDRFPIDLPG